MKLTFLFYGNLPHRHPSFPIDVCRQTQKYRTMNSYFLHTDKGMEKIIGHCAIFLFTPLFS